MRRNNLRKDGVYERVKINGKRVRRVDVGTKINKGVRKGEKERLGTGRESNPYLWQRRVDDTL
jgi:hypothetical protein